MKQTAYILPVLFAVLLAGCTRNTMIIIPSQEAIAKGEKQEIAAYNAGQKCRLTDAEYNKFNGVASNAIKPPDPSIDRIPEKLKAARLDGCAVVEYQLDDNGKPINLHTLHEEPTGYGIAENTKDSIIHTTFRAPAKQGEWNFTKTVMVTSTMQPK
jgi:hypothetical protein